jgi:Methyltransferase domain
VKAILKRLAHALADTRPVRALVNHLIYPTIVRSLRAEVNPDEPSPSGIAEQFAWKTHAGIVAWEELAGGTVCHDGASRSTLETRARLFDVVLAHIAGRPGDVFEFGVSSGDSFREFLKRCPDRQVYGFDSFQGLPEAWWTRSKGAFAADAPRLDNPNGHLVSGWFDSSVPEFFRNWSGTIALVHVDCDLYASTKIALQHALRFCRVGSVVLFDEYYNYPGFSEHEWLAWQQLRRVWQIESRCLAYDGRRAAFVIDAITTPSS